MPVETAADRAVFLSAGDFGAEGVYTPAGGAASPPIAGIFDDPSTSMVVGDLGVATIDARPTFLCQVADLPAGAEGGDAGDVLAIVGDNTFNVIAIEPDGQGMVLLRLGAAH